MITGVDRSKINMPEAARNHHYPEHTTPRRYHLPAEVIRDDYLLVSFANIHSRRIVVTGMPTEAQELHRQALLATGLVAGNPSQDIREEAHYEIPLDSRPLAYEAANEAKGSGVYTDAHLMRNLGRLLRTTFDVTEGRIIGGIAENAFLLREFVQPDEPKLLLAPGVEQLLVEPPQDAHPLVAQLDRFSDEFLARFEAHIGELIQGYQGEDRD